MSNVEILQDNKIIAQTHNAKTVNLSPVMAYCMSGKIDDRAIIAKLGDDNSETNYNDDDLHGNLVLRTHTASISQNSVKESVTVHINLSPGALAEQEFSEIGLFSLETDLLIARAVFDSPIQPGSQQLQLNWEWGWQCYTHRVCVSSCDHGYVNVIRKESELKTIELHVSGPGEVSSTTGSTYIWSQEGVYYIDYPGLSSPGFIFTPDDGHVIDSVFVDDTEQTGPPEQYVFNELQQDHTLEVNFV